MHHADNMSGNFACMYFLNAYCKGLHLGFQPVLAFLIFLRKPFQVTGGEFIVSRNIRIFAVAISFIGVQQTDF